MKRKLIKQWMPRILVVATLAATGAVIAADQNGSMMSDRDTSTYMQPGQMGYGMGPSGGMGMMGGGMMDMMMGGGPGMGMMGGGMMGGMGMGPGGGMGMGMMGMGPVSMLDLSDEQRDKIDKIFDAERKQHWSVMGKMMDVQNKLRDLYKTDQPDPKKVGAVYGEIAKLHQQMIEAHVQASNQMQQVLTKEQREQLRQWNRGGWGGGPRGPATGKPGTMGPGMMNR